MQPEIYARLEKVRRLIDSPNAGEAAAARLKYDEMVARYGATIKPTSNRINIMGIRAMRERWIEELGLSPDPSPAQECAISAILAQKIGMTLEAMGYLLAQDGDGSWSVARMDDLRIVLARDMSFEQVELLVSDLVVAGDEQDEQQEEANGSAA